MHRHQADDLGHIERGAAAETDHAIGVVGLESRSAGHDLGAGRIAEHAVEGGDLQTTEVRLELGHHRQRSQRAIGDDQRALAALLAQMLGHKLACAGTEGDRGGEGEAGDGHQMISK